MSCNLLHHSIKAYQVPVQPFHTQPGIFTAQMEKQFREEEMKVSVNHPHIHFCNHSLTHFER
jgi:hypothetical protein